MKDFHNPKEFLVRFDLLMPMVFISWVDGSAAQLGMTTVLLGSLQM